MYPVHYIVEQAQEFTRLQLALRVVAFLALGIIGISIGMVFVFAYLVLPVFAASRLASGRRPSDYLNDEGSRILRGLQWFAAVCAWAGLVAEQLPGRSPDEVVQLEVEIDAHPTASSAILRVITGIPSAIVLGLLGVLGVFVWLWGALCILVSQQLGQRTFRYLVGLQRWSIRLLVFQASLVDEYPPFSFADSTASIPAASSV